jgi:hypothetical protein
MCQFGESDTAVVISDRDKGEFRIGAMNLDVTAKLRYGSDSGMSAGLR